MHDAKGSRPWRELCAPAIEQARDGFCATHHYGQFAAEVREVLAADRRSHAVFLGGLATGVPPLAAIVRQPDLARTLEEIAEEAPKRSTAARSPNACARECGRPACW